MSQNFALEQTQLWLERAVIGLNLCPFAKAVHLRDKIRYVMCDSQDENALMQLLIDELQHLHSADSQVIDTTLIIAPNMLSDFSVFNDFLGDAQDELWVQGFDGVFQLASFHPQYQFEGTLPEDAQNNTNKAPYPTLHILREDSVEAALKSFANPETIYEHNIQTMEKLGNLAYAQLLKQ